MFFFHLNRKIDVRWTIKVMERDCRWPTEAWRSSGTMPHLIKTNNIWTGQKDDRFDISEVQKANAPLQIVRLPPPQPLRIFATIF